MPPSAPLSWVAAVPMAQGLLERMPQADYLGLEIGAIQHAAQFGTEPPAHALVAAGAQAIPEGDGQFDLALMLKSLHHVPLAAMDTAVAEVARVLRPGAFLYFRAGVRRGHERHRAPVQR